MRVRVRQGLRCVDESGARGVGGRGGEGRRNIYFMWGKGALFLVFLVLFGEGMVGWC